jgi:hypothetical protein
LYLSEKAFKTLSISLIVILEVSKSGFLIALLEYSKSNTVFLSLRSVMFGSISNPNLA